LPKIASIISDGFDSGDYVWNRIYDSGLGPYVNSINAAERCLLETTSQERPKYSKSSQLFFVPYIYEFLLFHYLLLVWPELITCFQGIEHKVRSSYIHLFIYSEDGGRH
jgi:hypothetical protein